MQDLTHSFKRFVKIFTLLLKLRNVKLFKYLGRVVANDYCDTPIIWCNHKKVRATWEWLQKEITQEAVPS